MKICWNFKIRKWLSFLGFLFLHIKFKYHFHSHWQLYTTKHSFWLSIPAYLSLSNIFSLLFVYFIYFLFIFVYFCFVFLFKSFDQTTTLILFETRETVTQLWQTKKMMFFSFLKHCPCILLFLLFTLFYISTGCFFLLIFFVSLKFWTFYGFGVFVSWGCPVLFCFGTEIVSSFCYPYYISVFYSDIVLLDVVNVKRYGLFEIDGKFCSFELFKKVVEKGF